jgi:hypothetical protein
MQNEVAETLLQLLSTELRWRTYIGIAALAVVILVICIIVLRKTIKCRIRQFKIWRWKTPDKHYGYYVLEREVNSLTEYVKMSKRDDHRWIFFSEKLWRDRKTGKWWFKCKGYRVNP